MSQQQLQPPAPRRRLPRHVVGAISVALGFVGGITLLLVLPKLGVPPKLAGFISLGLWVVSTWPFWAGGSAGEGKG